MRAILPMLRMSPALAAAAAFSLFVESPAQAQRSAPSGWSAGAGAVSLHRGSPQHGDAAAAHRRGGERRWDRDRRRHRSHAYPVFIGGYGYYEDNSAWEPDSYNDWWHERPDRSLPRWVSQNRNCERVWWSGGAWRC